MQCESFGFAMEEKDLLCLMQVGFWVTYAHRGDTVISESVLWTVSFVEFEGYWTCLRILP